MCPNWDTVGLARMRAPRESFFRLFLSEPLVGASHLPIEWSTELGNDFVGQRGNRL